MPALDAVTQTFIADTTPYVAALDRAAAAAREFAAANAAAASTAQALRSQLGDTAGTALELVSAEHALAAAMADKTAEAMFQASVLNDLRADMGFMYLATRVLAAGEADLARQLALTAGIMEVVVRANGDLALQSLYASQALDVQQKALTGTGTDLVLASDAAGRFSQSEYELIMVMAEKTGAASRQGAQLKELSGDFAATAAATTVFSAAEQKAAGSTRASTGIMIGWWRLTGNAIHWIIAGLAEYLAVALPGSIALGLGAFVMYQGVVEDVTRRMTALYTATEATAAMIGKTTGDVLGLGHAFQTAQNEANPIPYQLLGDYIEVAKQHMGDFAAAGLQVADAVRELGARIQVDLLQHGAEFTGLLSHMVSDVVEFGQILGNLGHALLNFASDMPGLAEKLLLVADAISKVILWISELPHWLIEGFMAFEEFIRWGGLLLNLLGRLTGVFVSLSEAAGLGGLANSLRTGQSAMADASTAASHFGTVLKNVFVGIGTLVIGAMQLIVLAFTTFYASIAAGEGIMAALSAAWEVLVFNIRLGVMEIEAALGPAGLAFIALGLLTGAAIGLAEAFGHTKTAAEQLGDSLEKNITNASNVNALLVIAQSIGKVNEQAAKTPALVNSAGVSFRYSGDMVKTANQSYTQLTSTQTKMIGQFANVVGGADTISKAYGTDFAQSLELADVAGVKLAGTQVILGKNANIAGAEIQALVQGYKAMDQTGGTLGTDMNALAIQAGLAGTKVSSLNSALDQFVSNGISVTNNLATMNQDLTQIGNVGVAVGGAFEVFHGQVALAVNAAAKSLESFSGTGAQTWQNFNAGISQAQQLTDSFRTAAAYGGVSTKQFTGAIANTVASLLPFTTHSATAVQELSMIAQEAGGPATSNFQTLKKWVDENGVSGGAFNKIMQEMTGQMDNAGSAAKEFASDLQSQMQAQMANALLGANNLNGAVKNFQSAVVQAGGHITASSPQYQSLYKMLTAAGLSAQQAKNELKLLQGTIDAMHSKTVTVGVEVAYSSSGTPPPYAPGASIPIAALMGAKGQHGMTVGFAGGGMVGGGSGVDAIHAMLTAGEAVLNARAVSALGGPMGVHSLNNQPSQGVLTSGGGGGGATALGLNLVIQSKLDGQTVNTNQRQATLIYNRRNPSNNLGLRTR